ncbi:uncharacterized protein [Venturia canescens]|uniref:uncharacterized protein isoform X2 n=1 Tax=Venturia canescens TaxID=32260 RepID=UPI001C9CE6B5|nr:uncharacterized protein LOC122416124 isoform X2 [Venturia canescens]
MSKFTIILCAVATFNVATSASGKKQDGPAALFFDPLLEKVESRALVVNKIVYNSSLVLSKMDFQIAHEFSKNASDTYEKFIELLPKMMADEQARGGKFNETQCTSYLTDFKETQSKVLNDLDEGIYGPLFEVMNPVTELLGPKTSEVKSAIWSLKEDADKLMRKARNLVKNYMTESQEVLDNFSATINNSTIREFADRKLENLIDKANEAFNETLKCISVSR